MNRSEVLKTGLFPGALAGLVGGLLFGTAMSELGRLSTIAELVRTDSSAVGFIVLMVVATLLGAGFGILVWSQRPGAGETLFWGLVYGTFWWYLGTLTLLPLFRGDGLAWNVAEAQSELPVLLGLALYGTGTALALVVLRWRHHVQADSGSFDGAAIVRGGLAGLLSAALLGWALDAQDQLRVFTGGLADDSRAVAWLVVLVVGLIAGAVFALLYPRPTDGAGAGLIRGTVYGFLWWVVGGLTVLPLIGGEGLNWSFSEVRGLFFTIPGYLLFGAGVGLSYQWLGALVRLLFSDHIGGSGEEGVGTQGLRILGRSVLGGLVGGLLFSFIMAQIGFLPYVADLVGAKSSATGFFVHLVIAVLVGTSYGVLFRRQCYDLGSALGWGVSYGFFWWILGPLTLMPIFLGSTPQWNIDAASMAFPNLIGHLAYGAGLAVTFYLLEARYSPWWIPRTQVEESRVARRKEQVLTSAPALWTVLVAIGLTLPILLGTDTAVPLYK